MPTPVDYWKNLHTADCYGQPLGIHCNGCQRRALVALARIGAGPGNMTSLDTLPFKCRPANRATWPRGCS